MLRCFLLKRALQCSSHLNPSSVADTLCHLPSVCAGVAAIDLFPMVQVAAKGQVATYRSGYGDNQGGDNWRERREKRETGPVWMTRGSTAGKRGKFKKQQKRGGPRDSEERMDAVDRFRLKQDLKRDSKVDKSGSEANDDLFELSGLDVSGSGKSIRPFVAPQNPLDHPFSRPNLGAFNAVKPQHLKTLDAHFAEWFVGFAEAQGPTCFQSGPDGRSRFSLHHTTIAMHYKIREHLKFGQVDVEKAEWYVEKPEGIMRVFSLLNGNLFVEDNRRRFKEWFEEFKENWESDEAKELSIDMECGWRPQLNNKWLMGFIDASLGMFAGRLTEAPDPPFFNVDLKFWVLHKDETLLQHLKQIFNGGVLRHDKSLGLHEWTAYRYKTHVKIKRYCRMFKPLSQKTINIQRYVRLVEYPIERVKTNRAWEKLKRLADSLNKDERKWAVTMNRHPYHELHKANVEKQIEVARRGGSKAEITATREEGDKTITSWEIHRPPPQPIRQI